jgi:cell division protein FtsB
METFETIPLDDVPRPPRRWSIWDRLIVAMLATTLLVTLGFFFAPLAKQRWEMETRLQQLQREKTFHDEQSRRLSWEITALQSDKDYIERVAREKLNLVAPGETIFQFGTLSPAVPAPRR